MPGSGDTQILNRFLQRPHHQLIEKIESEWKSSGIGLIYLDIVHFTEIERKYGPIICDKILSTLDHAFIELQHQYSSIFYIHRLVGDDFFIYIKMESNDQLPEDAVLKKASEEIADYIKMRVNEKIYEMNDTIDFHISYTPIYPTASKSVENTIYSAIKNVIRQAKVVQHNGYTKQQEEFQQILLQQSIDIHYQPIISLSLGTIFGYESLSRGPKSSFFHILPIYFRLQKQKDSYIL